ncbi:glutathione S-transferase C-terminal-like protein [Coniophora puteana RWD-64-598 SS2]|uniref:Glutathione S-transferase C-terminal-like protein n=1 Tax=Coniophora puteana (strain RWD-64-598) TaxID=741705 RepID=A0A5M3MDE9_CONPW|nr:glutathione S-transferase C-terminal-like protein [Coniophora puteana RWD-64-598 SS2]EIW76864.1 glutathione S-transferase C-terminal-like protein [Coniophora puteana RWD-64-598 SS2]
MAPIGTLYGVGYQRQTTIIKAAAAIGGLELNYVEVKMGETNKSPEYLEKFPQGKVPGFESANGFKVTEGLAIANYVASLAPESGLRGKNTEEAAEIEQWTHFTESEVQVSTDFSHVLTMGFLPGYPKELHQFLLERQYKSFEHLESTLGTREYLVGGRLTIADLTLAASLKRAFKVTLGASERAKYPKTIAYFEKIHSHEKLKEVYGEVEFAETPAQYKGSA